MLTQQIMAALALGAGAGSSPLTTHVLNTADGAPAARLAVSLHRLDPELLIWNMLTVG